MIIKSKKTVITRPDMVGSRVPQNSNTVDVAEIITQSRDEGPTIKEMAENFALAALRAEAYVRANGLSALIVAERVFDVRLNQGCRKCPQQLWDETGWFGAGKCNHSLCGCSRWKLWIASETCPINFWIT